jgi:hypothetical protein
MPTEPIESPYYSNHARAAIRSGQHREAVGGMWETMGKWQFDLLLRGGLGEDHYLLDVGCGCLRGGVHFINYLRSGKYYGIDMHEDLLDVGYDTELAILGLQDRLPRKNLSCAENFDASVFGVKFDFALAQSVFTHISLNKVRVCLERLAGIMNQGGRFFATYFPSSAFACSFEPNSHEPAGITSYADRDPYHCRFEDLVYLAGEWWEAHDLGDLDHPRGQHTALFIRA